jgi:hypothetical protein
VARINRPCPICEKKPPMVRQEVSKALTTKNRREEFIFSICSRCWDAMWDKPVNETEVLDGVH